MRTKKHKIDQDMPEGELKRMDDFLPPSIELAEIIDESKDRDLLKTIREGRCAIRGRAQGILLSESLMKRKKYHFGSA